LAGAAHPYARVMRCVDLIICVNTLSGILY